MVNQTLPIRPFENQIIETVAANPVTIIVAETGAGKSTQVPQFLLYEGYTCVVTQPRRLATRTLAMRVAEEIGVELGTTVGFRTAYEQCDSADTRCLFVTDGLELNRELMGHNRFDVLILDEIHERNINMDVLLAVAKLEMASNPKFKLIVMSATLDAKRMSEYFGNAPVINVPGRLFPVKEERPNTDMVGDTASLLMAGRNVLVFLPGKAEIKDFIQKLGKYPSLNAEILPLHSELEPADQQKCFAHYDRAKCVVATNVAQTSITIDDIDAVVDSGLERRIELVNGVEGLYLKPISRADSAQRKGRAGRCKPGIYIDHCPAFERKEYPVPEILRRRLDQTVLRLAEAGINAEELDFYDQPDREVIHEARRALRALGCMDENDTVTAIGHKVAKLPVSVQYARMIVEAERLGVVDDVITIAAILEQGGIVAHVIKAVDGCEYPATPVWKKRFCPAERESDVLAQLAVYKSAGGKDNNALRESGVSVKAYREALEKRKDIAKQLKGKVRFGSTGKREDILRAVCAGMVDHLYQHHGEGEYMNGDGGYRKVNRDSVVIGTPDWIVGKPFDLTGVNKMTGRSFKLYLINFATKVDPMWLAEVAPQLTRRERGFNPAYDGATDSVTSGTRVYFKDQLIAEVREPHPDHPEAAKLFRAWLVDMMSRTDIVAGSVPRGNPLFDVIWDNIERQSLASSLNFRTKSSEFKVYATYDMARFLEGRLNGECCAADITDKDSLRLPALNQARVAEVRRGFPDKLEVCGTMREVVYSEFGPPAIEFSNEESLAGVWKDLPDRGVFLPCGVQVTIRLDLGPYDKVTYASVTTIKRIASESICRKLWDNWGVRPIIAKPDPVAGSFPEIVEHTYGRHPLTNEELIAYGTIVLCDGFLTFVGNFEGRWYRTKGEAERASKSARAEFKRLYDLAASERTLRDVQNRADLMRSRAIELHKAYGANRGIPQDLRDRLRQRAIVMLGEKTDKLRDYADRTEKLLAQVQAALASAPSPTPVTTVVPQKNDVVKSSPDKGRIEEGLPDAVRGTCDVRRIPTVDPSKLFGGKAKVR